MNKILKKLRKLTLFDKLILFIALFVGLLFLYVFFRKQTFIDVTVKVGENDIQYSDWQNQTGTRSWFSELFYVGMKEKDGLGRVSSEVTNLWSYDTLLARKAMYIDLKLKVVYSKSSNQYTYKGSPVLVGYPIKLNLDKVYVQGIITNIKGLKDPRTYETLTIKAKLSEENAVYSETSGVKEYLANAIKVGDVMRDSRGQVMLTIVGKTVENAKKVVTTSDGRVLVQSQPFRKDVFLVLEVNAAKIGNRYYIYDDLPLLIGTAVPINISNLLIYPEIMSIQVRQ